MTSPSENEQQVWFLNTLVTMRVPSSAGKDGISILEHRAPYGDTPPLHVHKTEDEIFHIIAGTFRFKVGEEEKTLHAGEMHLMPKGVPHSYRVESKEGGHWMTITAHGDFEKLVRAVSRPAERPELPAPSGPPTEQEMKSLAEAAARVGIDIVGPPLH